MVFFFKRSRSLLSVIFFCFKCSVIDFFYEVTNFVKAPTTRLIYDKKWHSFYHMAIFSLNNVSQVCFKKQKLCLISRMKPMWWNVFDKYCNIYKRPLCQEVYCEDFICMFYVLELYMFV